MTEDQEFEEFLLLAQGVGFVVVTWAAVERQLDNWVYTAFHNGGKEMADKGVIPTSFKKKKKFLRDSFGKLPAFAEFSVRGIKILDDATAVAATRTDFVHGTLDGLVATDGAFHFRRLILGNHTHEIKEFTFNPRSEWPMLEKSLMVLLSETANLSAEIAKKLLKRK